MENTNTTMLYCLAAIYVALTESITATFGKNVEPLANSLIKDMLPQMAPDAANLCRDLVEFTSSDHQAAPLELLTRLPDSTVH